MKDKFFKVYTYVNRPSPLSKYEDGNMLPFSESSKKYTKRRYIIYDTIDGWIVPLSSISMITTKYRKLFLKSSKRNGNLFTSFTSNQVFCGFFRTWTLKNRYK